MTTKRNELRAFVRGVYDIQKLRIQMGQRIVSNAKVIAGIEPGTKEEDSKEADKLMKQLRKEHKRMAEALSVQSRLQLLSLALKGDESFYDVIRAGERDVLHGIIASPAHIALMDIYEELVTTETHQFKAIEKLLSQFSIWNDFLANVSGVGPAMGGIIISEIDIAVARYPSSLWKYAGLDVANGKGRTRHKEHLIKREYTAADGTTQERDSITYNPLLKTKLIGVLGPSFLRAGDNKYSLIYRGYKNRLENHSVHKEKTKGHRHNMAIRYMVKRFLVDLYVWWRAAEGLPVAEEYSESKLRLVHSDAAD